MDMPLQIVAVKFRIASQKQDAALELKSYLRASVLSVDCWGFIPLPRSRVGAGSKKNQLDRAE